MSSSNYRRAFLSISTAAALGLPLMALAQPGQLRGPGRRDQPRRAPKRPGSGGPVVISSANGLRATEKAMAMLRQNADPLDAIVAGVAIIENDPNDMSVGLGGLPNADGVVELDSCVMHGRMARSGAVGALRNIKNPAAVAREVARRTDHCQLMGEGALKFALQLGFKEENLLTEKARQAWVKWRANLNPNDDWLNEDQFDLPADGHSTGKRGVDARPLDGRDARPTDQSKARRIARALRDDHLAIIDGVPYTTGTIHCSALTTDGDLAGCTTTSGLSWKIPGRVGDSPIVGAGCFTDNEIGSAGATGRGEAVIQTCGSHTIVMRMDLGDSPTDACLYALKKIADHTKPSRLLDDKGRPNFQVVYYALRKDGAIGSASLWSGRSFSVNDGVSNRHEPSAFLYEQDS